MIRVREVSQVLRDLCVALLLEHFEFVLRGPARLEGVALPLPRGCAAPLCAWLSPAVVGALSACRHCLEDLEREMLLFEREIH